MRAQYARSNSTRLVMVRNSHRAPSSIRNLIDEVYQSGVVPRRSYAVFTQALLAGQPLADEERYQILRILDSLRLKRLRLLD